MSTATFDRLHVDDLLGEIQDQGEQRAREAVLAFADDGEITPAELREILLSADWSQDKFRAAVNVAVERREAVDTLERSRVLGEQLPELQAAVSELERQVAAEERAHRERMAPLQAKHQQAAGEFQACRLEHDSLHRDALQTLNRTLAPEARREHAALCNRGVLTQQQLQAAQVKAHELGERITAAEGAVKQAEAEVRYRQERKADIDCIAQAQRAVEKLSRDLAALHRIGNELKTAEHEHNEAREALATWEREAFTDWRRMDFGSGQRGETAVAYTRRSGESHLRA